MPSLGAGVYSPFDMSLRDQGGEIGSFGVYGIPLVEADMDANHDLAAALVAAIEGATLGVTWKWQYDVLTIVDPVTKASYQMGLDQGVKGINNMAGARGGRNSGATLKALTRFGTDYTGGQAAGSQARYVNDQTNTYNRYAGLSGTGQVATQATSAAGQNAANTISGLTSSLGNARGASAISSGNAWSGALGNIANNY